MESPDALIIGAGLAGLTAADSLLKAGRSVRIIDKGLGLGGRLATRRIDEARLDHGAQFFTVRGDDFRAVVERAISEGVVDTWCHGFGQDDGYPRYYCPDGMTALAKWLASDLTERGATIELGIRANALRADSDLLRATLDDGSTRDGNDLVVTAPIPQTLALLDSGEVPLDPSTRSQLEAVDYNATLALLVTLDGPSNLKPPGGLQRDRTELFTFIADNALKGVSDQPALTFHVSPIVSAERWDDEPESIIAELMEPAAEFIGEAKVMTVELKKWRYAGPKNPLADRALNVATNSTDAGGRIVLAGDAFGGPKVEGAFNSGRAAGELLA